MLRGPRLLTRTHPRVGHIGQVKIHVEGVGGRGVVITEELVHRRRAVSVCLLLAVCMRWERRRLWREVPVHLTLYLGE